jgi:hypothetical protein
VQGNDDERVWELGGGGRSARAQCGGGGSYGRCERDAVRQPSSVRRSSCGDPEDVGGFFWGEEKWVAGQYVAERLGIAHVVKRWGVDLLEFSSSADRDADCPQPAAD